MQSSIFGACSKPEMRVAAGRASGIKLGDDGGGGIDGPDGWHPAGLSAHLPILSSLCLFKYRMSSGTSLFRYWPTQVVQDKGL